MSDGPTALEGPGALDGPGAVFASLSYPMAIVTASTGTDRAGCLVGFHTQCSIEPARYLVCISSANRTARVAGEAPALVVHFLTRADAHLAHVFGEESGDEVDKFAQCEWSDGPFGAPLLRHGGSWVAGPIVERYVLGDHHGMVIDASRGGGVPPAPQLQYDDVRQFRAGHPA
jgi:flavin reductase (DIM6/NTAB) family NADH-FMN oxidoreductase RutF